MIERILPSTALLHNLQIYRKTKKHKETTWQDFWVSEKSNYFHIFSDMTNIWCNIMCYSESPK